MYCVKRRCVRWEIREMEGERARKREIVGQLLGGSQSVHKVCIINTGAPNDMSKNVNEIMRYFYFLRPTFLHVLEAPMNSQRCKLEKFP